MERVSLGTTMPNVNQPIVAALELRLPPLAEQRRIAAILDESDALRTKRSHADVQLDGLIQAVFDSTFGPPDSVLDRWPVTKLGEELDFLTSGSRGWARHYSAEGDVFLRIQNVKRDSLDLDDLARVKAPQTAEAKRTRVKAGDVLVSITADLGRTAVIPEHMGTAYINQHLAILRSSSLNPRFLSAYLSSARGQRELLGRNRQGVKAGLNFDDIRSICVPKPPTEIQENFAANSWRVDSLRAKRQENTSMFETLFLSLQSRAFSGKL